MEQQNITAIKGIGEKTAKLFQKIGVETVEELLHYYPRAYDEFKEPQPIAELKEDTIAAVGGILAKTADVVRYGARLQVTTAGLRGLSLYYARKGTGLTLDMEYSSFLLYLSYFLQI